MAVVIPAVGNGTTEPPVHTALKGSDHVQSVRSVPISAKRTYATEVTVAAGGQVTIDSTQISVDKTGHLMGVHVAASVMLKAEIRTVQNGIASGNAVVDFGRSVHPVIPGPEYVSVAYSATAGLDGFRVVVTNLDTSEAADVYATFFYDEL